MRIYTSYFANTRNINKNITLISIARFPPKGYKGIEYLKLAPSRELIFRYNAGQISDKEYIEIYNSFLSSLDPINVINDIRYISGKNDACLLCYEGRDKFCHRHLVSAWLNASVFNPMSKGKNIIREYE